MTTRKQLETEQFAKREDYSKRLKELEEQHKSFADEDVKQSQLDDNYYQLSKRKDALVDKAYLNNWGSDFNYQHSQIPMRYRFNEDDTHIIRDALTKLFRDKLNEIKESSEYKELDRQQDEISNSRVISKEHQRIEREISDVRLYISCTDNFLRQIATKGGLIEICKGIKERERREIENRKRDALFHKYISKILEVNVKSPDGDAK